MRLNARTWSKLVHAFSLHGESLPLNPRLEARTCSLMNALEERKNGQRLMFDSPDWYDRTINWSARLGRELPVFMEVFGPPGTDGILDAGCGTGRQATALAQRGYRVIGVDASEDMLQFARRQSTEARADVRFLHARYDSLQNIGLGRLDGIYCIGNSLAAAGSAHGVATAIQQFAALLRPGGRLFLQILNFASMRRQTPCVIGPRVAVVDGREYISVRQFHFLNDLAQVTNITIWNEGGWRQCSHCGQLYPVELDELRAWCSNSGLKIDDLWGGYDREPFNPASSVDLIVVATRP